MQSPLSTNSAYWIFSALSRWRWTALSSCVSTMRTRSCRSTSIRIWSSWRWTSIGLNWGPKLSPISSCKKALAASSSLSQRLWHSLRSSSSSMKRAPFEETMRIFSASSISSTSSKPKTRTTRKQASLRHRSSRLSITLVRLSTTSLGSQKRTRTWCRII